jgi:hypothetical protein
MAFRFPPRSSPVCRMNRATAAASAGVAWRSSSGTRAPSCRSHCARTIFTTPLARWFSPKPIICDAATAAETAAGIVPIRSSSVHTGRVKRRTLYADAAQVVPACHDATDSVRFEGFNLSIHWAFRPMAFCTCFSRTVDTAVTVRQKNMTTIAMAVGPAGSSPVPALRTRRVTIPAKNDAPMTNAQ